MIRNKIKYCLSLSIIILFILLSGCQNFLQEDPKGLLTPKTFYNSDDEVKAAVNGIYHVLGSSQFFAGSTMLKANIWGTDIASVSRKQYSFIANYQLQESNHLDKLWKGCYRIIQNSTAVISNIRDNSNISNEAKNKAVGQLLFIRAFGYFVLTNMWGNVPYFRKKLSLQKIAKLPRTNKHKIREDMLKDLQKAATLLPGHYPKDQTGRVTKWAAKFLKAKYALWLKQWKVARDAAVDIIQNSDRRLLDNFGSIFKYGNWDNDEIIWQIFYLKNVYTSAGPNEFNPRLRDEPKNGSQKQALKDTLAKYGEGFTGYGHVVANCEFARNFPKNDDRRKWTVGKYYHGIELNFPYFQKLWSLDQIKSPRNNHGDNDIIFRMGEVYLIAAEAENELNGPGDAYQYINKVRKRANAKILSGLSKEQFRKAVHREYAYEKAGEGRRRWQLVRWGILVKRVRAVEHCVFKDMGSNLKPYMTLFPIPEIELNLNPNLTQNPGY